MCTVKGLSVIEELRKVSIQKGTAVTIGVFDGVHLGHQSLLRRTMEEARARGLLSAVLTFRNHPRTVLTPGFQPRYLMDLDHRLKAMESLGLDRVVAITFTRAVSQLRAREFVTLLKDKLRMKVLVVGPDFALGSKREGDIAMLSELGGEMDFQVSCMDLVQEGDQVVSSTVIRDALAQGDVARARSLLSRPFNLSGQVVVGEKRGRILGFPTANLEVDAERALPADGIYATRARVKGTAMDSISYIGTNPTFDGVKRSIEVYIFDFDGDLYGQRLSVDFITQVRGDARFSGPQELIDQMNRDVARAREVLAESYVNG